jgi:hypothetical protein
MTIPLPIRYQWATVGGGESVAELPENTGEPSGTRTRDPLIESESADLRTTMHDEVSTRDSEGR